MSHTRKEIAKWRVSIAIREGAVPGSKEPHVKKKKKMKA